MKVLREGPERGTGGALPSIEKNSKLKKIKSLVLLASKICMNF
jgi:hypothetical protein